MNGWKKRALAAALCALALLSLAAPSFGASGAVYLMAVNDTVLVDVTTENMPRLVGGVLYVPYTMLSSRSTGINLGVNAMYSATRRTVLVSDSVQRGVIFDTQANTAQDLSGEPVAARAMVRNSMVFLPIDWLCSYFGSISCSRSYTRHGTLVRVTSGAAILSDRDFVDAADPQLADCLERYLAGAGSGEEQPTAPSQTPPAPISTPEPSAAPSGGAELFLALHWGEEAEECARVLERQGRRALFLLDWDGLEEQDGLIRRLVGAGHTVGLALTGATGEECLAQAEEGRRRLAAIARYNALIVSAGGLDRAGRQELAQAGCVVWAPTARGGGYSSGAALVQGLNPRRMNYVELECGAGGAGFLRGALSAAEEENCQLHHATAPALS